jgi:hypothetical protein
MSRIRLCLKVPMHAWHLWITGEFQTCHASTAASVLDAVSHACRQLWACFSCLTSSLAHPNNLLNTCSLYGRGHLHLPGSPQSEQKLVALVFFQALLLHSD